MNERWYPPRGSVTLTCLEDGSWRVDCSACDWTYPSNRYRSNRSDAEFQKSCHRCPPGTAKAFPRCPECGATGKQCRWADGPSATWHSARSKARTEGLS